MVVPELLPCPRCALHVQRGDNPDGLVWHDCDEVAGLREATTLPSTLEGTEQAILGLLLERARRSAVSPSELVEVLRALRELQGATGATGASEAPAPSDKLKDWIRAAQE